MISARRTNTAIGIVVALLLVITLVVAVFGTPTSAPTIDDVANTTVTTSPPTNNTDNEKDPESGLTRDADTSDSWFSHTFAVEQFDFPMDELSCDEMEQYFTLELCVVAQTSRGDFMVTATEAFWDSQVATEKSTDIELNLMVYVHTTDNGPARAMSVLDGNVSSPYTASSSLVRASTFSVTGDDIVVLEWSSSGDEVRATDRTWSAIQVIAMGPGGLPDVVATYGGSDISYGSDSQSLVLTSERFGPPSRSSEAEPWLTVLRLSPSTSLMTSSKTSSTWQEIITSQPVSQFDASSLSQPDTQDTYEFPRRRTTSGSIN